VSFKSFMSGGGAGVLLERKSVETLEEGRRKKELHVEGTLQKVFFIWEKMKECGE